MRREEKRLKYSRLIVCWVFKSSVDYIIMRGLTMCISINLKFYFSSDKYNCINELLYSFYPYLLDPFNSLYAERLLFRLSEHFIAYHLTENHSIWNLGYRGNFLNIPGITIMQSKQKLPGVSGNTGESLIIPSLAYATWICFKKLDT